MCGIAGVFEFGRSESVTTREILLSMCGIIAHRGPDDEGTYADEKNGIWLGHRRLSIIDLSDAGHQPMCNEDGSIWVIFNGETYNHMELRKYLLEQGHTYKSACDTETLLHLYEEKGEDMLSLLDGMFAFAIWDTRKRKIFMARDRMGIKPFYYYMKDGIFLFASEIKAILKHPFAVKKMDETSLYHYLSFITVPAPNTMFEGVKKIPQGHCMTIDGNGEIELKQYWDIPVKPSVEELSETEYTQEVLRLLKESIRKRTMSDVPFGTFLSGGVDSSMNVALMTEALGRSVNTFSVGFKEESEYNELVYARKVAKKFNTNHHEVLIDNKDFMDFFPSLVHYQDEPLADPVCIPLHYVSKLARDNNVLVVQVGEGADELFFGYSFYEDFFKQYPKWLLFKRSPTLLKKLFVQLAGPYFDVERRDFLVRALDGNDPFFWGGAIAFRELEKKVILSSEAKNKFAGMSSSSEVAAVMDVYKRMGNKEDFINSMIYLEFKIRLPELLLMRVDKVSMISSIETRVPYLDHKLVEFGMSIPSWLKRKGGVTKYPLKKIAEQYLDKEIIYRKKVGFCGSSQNMLTPELFEYGQRAVFESPMMGRYFDKDAMKEIFNLHKTGAEEKSLRIWNLMNLVLWHKHWFE